MITYQSHDTEWYSFLFLISGYLVIGSALLVITWSLLLLPRMLPGARRRVLHTLRNAAMKGKDSLYEVIKTLRPAKRAKGQGGMSVWTRAISSSFLL